MNTPRTIRSILLSDTSILIYLALIKLIIHIATDHQYGFHRDELAMIDDARHPAWGYVAYPPVTPIIGWIALTLFGPSMVGVRFFSALAQSIAMVLAGLIAREMGASRHAQIVTTIAAGIGTIALSMGAMFQYVSFDYLWWVLIAYFVTRLVKSDDPRWWVGIGAVIGLGMMTKYTMIFFVAGVVIGMLLTETRRHLRSPWLWAGVGLSVLIFVPNAIWQVQHDFISLDFLTSIHERDIRIGRTEGYLAEQILVGANPLTFPLALAGLGLLFFSGAGKPFRVLGWMFLTPFVLFLVSQGRSYYLAPAYPMLIAGGVALGEQWLKDRGVAMKRTVTAVTWVLVAAGGVIGGALALPVAPVNSPLWEITSEVHDNFIEQIGWQELAEEVSRIYESLPDEDRKVAGIYAGNYGEAGAINLYGPALGLPEAISGANSYWLRGYGDPPPEVVIVVGEQRESLTGVFETCELAGHTSNRYGVINEETEFHPDIFVCRGLRMSWPELWEAVQSFG
jgi:4-amino-4-deoxy-L-arabinose transferase-like glycosyltransferase